MGKLSNRWIPNQRSYRHDNRRFHRETPPAEISENSVPEWEKRFCYKVGSVPWRKVLDTKSFASYYPDVMDWDDSEAKDTFHIAKRRFWELMNGVPADDVLLPDPNAYIDEVDWNSIDTDLLVELESALLAAGGDGAAVNVTEAVGNGVVDMSVLTRKSKWHEWNQVTADDGWDNGGCWNNSNDGGWEKADKWDSNPVNNVKQDDLKFVKSGDSQWECEPDKRNGSVKNIAWRDSNDKSWGWKQPGLSHPTKNLHDVANPQDDNFHGREPGKGNGRTESGNVSWCRNRQREEFYKTKACSHDPIQHNRKSAAKEWNRHGGNSHFGNSLVNNQHKQTEAYYKDNGNRNTGNWVDRKRESHDYYAPRGKSPIVEGTGNRRHGTWRNGQSMQQTGSKFGVQT